MLNNLQEQSKLWDKKYLTSRNYENLKDFFKFSDINPTILAIEMYIKKGMKILEVGSGTGELISYLKYKYPDIEAFGIDFSAYSIERSKKVVENFGISVDFVESDISGMPFEDNYFDIIYGDQVLAHLDNIDLSLKEIYRVTKPNGLVAFTSANKLRPDGWDLYKKLSKSHEGYKQVSFFPWILNLRLNSVGFKKIQYYGDIIFLFRNISLMKSWFKKSDKKIEIIISDQEKNVTSKKNIYKDLYHFIDRNTPSFLKVTIGILAKK